MNKLHTFTFGPADPSAIQVQYDQRYMRTSYPVGDMGSLYECRGGWSMMLTTHLHVAPRLKMCGPLFSHPYMST
jgi:hypothetical protein